MNTSEFVTFLIIEAMFAYWNDNDSKAHKLMQAALWPKIPNTSAHPS